MPTFPDEIYDEFDERCITVNMFTKSADQREGGRASLGAIVRTRDDGFLAVEVGQHPDDTGFVTVRRFDRFGDQIGTEVLEVDGTVLITA